MRHVVIPFLDLARSYEELQDELDAAFARVMRAGRYIGGDEVDAFEHEFAQFCGSGYCVSVGNGLEALHLILRALDIGPGTEVIVPGNTNIATWLAVTHAGATPVPADPLPDTYNLDPDAVVRRLSPRTRAIIAVHLYGQPAAMDALAMIAREHGLELLEDASQAHGAAVGARRAGALSRAAAFSLYPTKNLGAYGDGGAVVTSDAALARRVRILRNYGAERRNHVEVCGFNSRLDVIQAAMLRVRLKHLDSWNARRVAVAEHYTRALGSIPECSLPVVPKWASPVWHQFVIRHRRRDAMIGHLASLGIETDIHYPIPPHRTAAYAHLGITDEALPTTAALTDTILSLPINPHLSPGDVEVVCSALASLPPADES